MTFTSFNFLIFFPLVALFYYLTPIRSRWLFLLLASYFFYLNIKPVYILLTASITLSTFIFTRLIESTRSEAKKRSFMIINIILILLPLFFFKYFMIVNNTLLDYWNSHHLRWPLPEIKLILPVGISFYTFMALGYIIDVYNEEIKCEKNLGVLALFISFFPLVLSGPIERAKNMLPQFKTIKPLNYNNISKGLRYMLWGYFMKLVVADRIGIYVDAIYNNIYQHNGTSLLLASLLHPFQVYADLGGYSLIAIGTAKVIGFNVMCNFNRPFFATSMAEFWRRWHISLIKWLTDYIYTPLSFSLRKYGIWGIVIALLLTFIISGIWHGASMTFIVWGLMQGIFLSIEALTNRRKILFEKKYNLSRKSIYLLISMLFTYILFCSSLIFGRSENLAQAFEIYSKIFNNPGVLYIDKTTMTYALLGLVVLLFKDFKDEFFPGKLNFFSNRNIYVRYAAYLFVLFIILLFGVLDGGQFIYFQF